MRRLINLARWLPPNSALHRSIDPEGTGVGWDLTTHLLALIAEVCDVTNNVLIQVNTEESYRAPAPLSIPRPGKDAKPEAEGLQGPSLEAEITKLGGAVVHG